MVMSSPPILHPIQPDIIYIYVLNGGNATWLRFSVPEGGYQRLARTTLLNLRISVNPLPAPLRGSKWQKVGIQVM